METATRRLQTAGVPHEILSLPETHDSAAALGYPAAYVGRTVSVETADGPALLVRASDATPDALREVAALDAIVPNDAPEGACPFAAEEGVRVVWDGRLLRAPVVLVPGDSPGEVLKIDSRHLGKLELEAADLTAPKAAGASAYDALLERGFIDRVTNEALARERLGDPDVAAYIGFDPSADSLHVGSLVPIMALAHVQRSGGRAIAVVGGATGLIGDPSMRTELRNMLTREDAEGNVAGLRRQLGGYLEIDDRRHLLLNNADWLADRNYIDFLREVGRHFSVNRMLAAECFKSRLEQGLSFLEFNYMLLQAYDFVVLARDHNCKVQMGGSDQWGNICAGIDLGRRMNDEELAGVTFPLLMSATGRKFGKSEEGNVWLDPNRTRPHEFFQFWRNVDDLDVARFLGLFTFVPMDKVWEMCEGGAGPALNDAKKVLAFAATRLLHGEATAVECLRTAEALFGGVSADLRDRLVSLGLLAKERAGALEKPAEATGLPTVTLTEADLPERGFLPAVIADLGLAKSRGEARRLVAQGGVYVNDERVTDPSRTLTPEDFADGAAMVRVGKKKHGRVELASL